MESKPTLDMFVQLNKSNSKVQTKIRNQTVERKQLKVDVIEKVKMVNLLPYTSGQIISTPKVIKDKPKP